MCDCSIIALQKFTYNNSDEICLYKNILTPNTFEADTFHRLSNLNKTFKFNITKHSKHKSKIPGNLR